MKKIGKQNNSKVMDLLWGKVNIKTFQFKWTFIRTLRWWKILLDGCFIKIIGGEKIYIQRKTHYCSISILFLKNYHEIGTGNCRHILNIITCAFIPDHWQSLAFWFSVNFYRNIISNAFTFNVIVSNACIHSWPQTIPFFLIFSFFIC